MSLKTAGLWDCISKDKVPLELSNFEPIPPREVWCSTLGSFDWKLNVEYVLAFFFSLSSLVHSRKCTNYLKKLRVPCWDFDGDKELNFQKIYKKNPSQSLLSSSTSRKYYTFILQTVGGNSKAGSAKYTSRGWLLCSRFFPTTSQPWNLSRTSSTVWDNPKMNINFFSSNFAHE